MNIYVRPSQYRAVFVQLIMLIVYNITIRTVGSYNTVGFCQMTSVFMIVMLIFQIVGLNKVNRLYSIGTAFVLFSYIINLSFCVLTALKAVGSNSAFSYLFIPTFGYDSFVFATRFAFNSIVALSIGYTLVSAQDNGHGFNGVTTTDEKENLLIFKRVGTWLTVIFGLIYIVSIAFQVYVSMSYGTYAALGLVNSMYFVTLAFNLQAFFFAGIYLLMIYYKKVGRVIVSKRLFFFAVLLILIGMLSGARSRSMMILIVLMFFYFNDIEKPTPKKIVLYIILGFILLQFMAAIRMARSGAYSFSSILGFFTEIESNIFYETANEFGTSIFVTAGFNKLNLSGQPIDFFISQIGDVIPRISYWGGKIFESAILQSGFEERYHIGTTYIADFYYYFGNLGPLIISFFGAWIALIENRISTLRKSGEFLSIAIWIPGLISIVNTIRASATLGLKMIVYSYIIIWFFTAFYSRGKNH